MRKLRFRKLEQIPNITQLINLEAGIWVEVYIVSKTFVSRNFSMFLGYTGKIKPLLTENFLHMSSCAQQQYLALFPWLFRFSIRQLGMVVINLATRSPR